MRKKRCQQVKAANLQSETERTGMVTTLNSDLFSSFAKNLPRKELLLKGERSTLTLKAKLTSSRTLKEKSWRCSLLKLQLENMRLTISVRINLYKNVNSNKAR